MTNTLSAYLEQEIMSADPLELVCMLYQAAIMEVREARRYLASGNITGRAAAISKASNIIGELVSSLDREAGGELADRLGGLYGYLLGRLLDANMRKADEPLTEVIGLLTTMAEGWQGARTKKPVYAAAQPAFFPVAASEAVSQSWSF